MKNNEKLRYIPKKRTFCVKKPVEQVESNQSYFLEFLVLQIIGFTFVAYIIKFSFK